MTTIITHPDGTDFVCACGNTPETDGFFTCDADGNIIEPTLDGDWEDLYACGRCGQLHRFEEAK